MHRFTLPVLLALAAGFACAADPALSGKWKLHSSIQGYEGELTCDFTQDGQNVSGACKSNDPSAGPIQMKGKLAKNELMLQYKTMYNGDELTVIYTAKIESAEKFSGRVDVQPVNADGDFVATPMK